MTAGLRPILFLVVLGASWGLYFSLLKIAALSGISYVGIITLTTAGVGAGLTAIALLRRRKPRFDARHLRFYGVCALSGYLLPMIAELLVIAHMPAGVLTLIVSMAPLATLTIAWLMRTDRIDLARVGGIGLGAFAVIAILLPEAHAGLQVDWRWLLLALAVPLSYAVHHNYASARWPQGSDSYQVACGEALVASALMAAFAAFNWEAQDLQSWNGGHAAILVMAAIALIDIYLYFELIRIRGPIFTSHANYFMVASGVFWGMIIFAEELSPMIWLSALLLMVSLYLVGERRSARRKAPVERD